MSKLKLSKKYGANPTIPVCYWCGKEKDEIVLLGKIGKGKEDIEAPKNMVMNYDPCDECQKKMALGVTLIAVTDIPHPEKQFPIQEGLYPTGSWSVISEEAAQRIFGDVLGGNKKVLVTEESYKELFAKEDTPDASD